MIITEYPIQKTCYYSKYEKEKKEVEDPDKPGTKKEVFTGKLIKQVTSYECACYTFKFPQEFIDSKNKRWVEFHHAKVTYDKDEDTKELVLHSDIIQRDPYLDHSVMVINEVRTKYKKYEYTQHNDTFTIWFSSFKTPKGNVLPENVRFMVEMMLIY